MNQTQDNRAFDNALNACFTIHELNHAHWADTYDNQMPAGLVEGGRPNLTGAPGSRCGVEDGGSSRFVGAQTVPRAAQAGECQKLCVSVGPEGPRQVAGSRKGS